MSEDIIQPVYNYSDHSGNEALAKSLKPFMGSQEVVTGLVDFLTAMLLLYLYYVMGTIDMVAGVDSTGVGGSSGSNMLNDTLHEEGS